jgi:hypothetical protein
MDPTVESLARATAEEIGFEIEILSETTSGKCHALNLGIDGPERFGDKSP